MYFCNFYGLGSWLLVVAEAAASAALTFDVSLLLSQQTVLKHISVWPVSPFRASYCPPSLAVVLSLLRSDLKPLFSSSSLESTVSLLGLVPVSDIEDSRFHVKMGQDNVCGRITKL